MSNDAVISVSLHLSMSNERAGARWTCADGGWGLRRVKNKGVKKGRWRDMDTKRESTSDKRTINFKTFFFALK